jgi:hypothetical protein
VNSYIISYDLHRPGQNYQDLYDAIKNFGNWWHCLDSTWIVKHPGPSSTISGKLTPHIDANDKLIVIQLVREASWYGFDTDCSNWLTNNL